MLWRLGLVASKRYRKKYRAPVPRPVADAPGTLIQTDTVHLTSAFRKQKRVYLYTAIDVYSRWAYAEYHPRISQEVSARFLARAKTAAGFHFRCIQADNGARLGATLRTASRQETLLSDTAASDGPMTMLSLSALTAAYKKNALVLPTPSRKNCTARYVSTLPTTMTNGYTWGYSAKHQLKCCKGVEVITPLFIAQSVDRIFAGGLEGGD